MTIAHISDLHFGRIANDEIVGVLVDEVNNARVDLVAVSGDLTQRARRHEYQAAARMIEALNPPSIVVPGNHDVYPWWRPFSRVFHPHDRFRRYIGPDLAPTFEANGLAVLGLNSAFGRTVKSGKLSRADLEQMHAFYTAHGAHVFKVLVIHHHLTKIQGMGPHDVVRRAQEALRVASAAGVDLILCGHLHISHVEPLELKPERHRLVIVSAGTATSSRGRRSNRRTNFYNVIEVRPDNFLVEERRYLPERGQFVTDSTTRFDRVREEEEESTREAERT